MALINQFVNVGCALSGQYAGVQNGSSGAVGSGTNLLVVSPIYSVGSPTSFSFQVDVSGNVPALTTKLLGSVVGNTNYDFTSGGVTGSGRFGPYNPGPTGFIQVQNSIASGYFSGSITTSVAC